MVSTTTTIIVITTITTTTTVTQAGQQRGSVPYLVLKFLDESCSISNKDCQSTTYQYLMHTLGTHDMYDGLHDGSSSIIGRHIDARRHAVGVRTSACGGASEVCVA